MENNLSETGSLRKLANIKTQLGEIKDFGYEEELLQKFVDERREINRKLLELKFSYEKWKD